MTSDRPDATRIGGTVAVRDATLDDAHALAEIYNQAILDRIATLETGLRDAKERAAWLQARTPRTPVLVAEREGVIVGFGSLNSFSPRECYRYVADFSVYVDRVARGSGVGTTLLASLVAAATRLDYHKMVLSTFPWNTAGLKLYARYGFKTVGTYREMGRLDGEWVDTVIMEKLL